MKKYLIAWKPMIKRIVIMLMVIVMFVSLFMVSVTSLDDPVSNALRASTEKHINQYIETLIIKAELGTLGWIDKAALHTGVLLGISLSRVQYPEASILLYHYVYGNGSDLELPANYFQNSHYLINIISQYGIGEHGPIGLKQSDDWRLSLALNPYYLSIKQDEVRLYHPHISFAELQGERVSTVVPIGKLTIKIYDNLLHAFKPEPFYAYSVWSTE